MIEKKSDIFDKKYIIRKANKVDIPAIMQFIERHWNSDHIMARDRSFFEYEFLEENGDVNFILAIDREKQTIESLYGFLKASHDKSHLYIWGSFMKTLDGNVPLLGAELNRRLCDMAGAIEAIDVGDNPKTSLPLVKKLFRMKTAKMNHFYMLSDIQDFKIAKISDRKKSVITENSDAEIVKFNNIDEIEKVYDFKSHVEDKPYKDAWYIDHRFLQHPIYHYDVYGVMDGTECKALFVTRMQLYESRSALRIVDYIGDQTYYSSIGSFINARINDGKCEYADFYCLGFENGQIEKAGFVLRTENDPNIIPNYFYPYEQSNVEIYCAAKSEDVVITKADGDQDRPN